MGAYTQQQERTRREALAGLVQATYEDDTGRKWLVLVPPDETDLSRGIVQGPPDITELNLPERVAVRLHNELFNRGLITRSDVKGRAMEVHAALQAAYHVDATAILNLY